MKPKYRYEELKRLQKKLKIEINKKLIFSRLRTAKKNIESHVNSFLYDPPKKPLPPNVEANLFKEGNTTWFGGKKKTKKVKKTNKRKTKKK